VSEWVSECVRVSVSVCVRACVESKSKPEILKIHSMRGELKLPVAAETYEAVGTVTL